MKTNFLDSAPKILGNRYRLHYLVAQNDCSRVFLATDLASNNRKCAIKQLVYPPNLKSSKIRLHIECIFWREVEISKKIAGQHMQLCQFYNCLLDDSGEYLVQEWIDGTTLEAQLNRQSKLSESETKSILMRILLVLERIHSLGIVHNDIKPSNVILRQKDRFPVLIDFGVAKKINVNYGQIVAGTPGYMSWEQAMGKSVVTNDLYSLGMMGIYLLTGQSPQSINFSDRHNCWQQAKASLNPQLVKVIEQAIAQDARQRFNSATEMLAMLRDSAQKSVVNHGDHTSRSFLSEYLSSILVLALWGLWLYLHYSTPQFNSKPPVEIDNWSIATPDFSLSEEELQPTELETTNNALKQNIFVIGTSATIIANRLGEPLWRKSGFWANSIAWSYEDVVSEGIDLGYIFDSQTEDLRQVEIAVPPTTDTSTLVTALNSFMTPQTVTTEIQQGLENVYHRQQDTYRFTINNLEGIIQRNAYDRLYVAVWATDFH